MATLRSFLWRLVEAFRPVWEPKVFARNADIYTILESAWCARALYVAAALGIADLLHGGPKTLEDLAAATGAHPRYLYRVLRVLAAFNLLREDRSGRFHLTRRAATLQTDHPRSMRHWVLLLSGTWYLSCFILDCVKSGKSAAELAFGEKTVWGLYDRDPVAREHFLQGMAIFSSWQAPLIAGAYNFGRFTTVCDVGGGRGRFLIEVLRRYPQLKGILYDQPGTIEVAKADIEAAGLSHRCQTIAGDFLDSVPEGADAYIIKHALHDWEDEDAQRILGNIRRVLPPKGVLLAIHGVLRPGNGVDRLNKLVDLEYLLVGGRMRTRGEFENLFRLAGLKLVGAHPTPVLDATILEAIPNGART